MGNIVSLIAIKVWLKKCKALCKKYWQMLVGAAIPILLIIIFRKGDDLKNVLERIHEDYEKEIDVINMSHEKEIANREEARKIYLESIKKIEENYYNANKDLDSKKRKEIEKVISDNVDNPDEITRRISEITGFEIHIL